MSSWIKRNLGWNATQEDYREKEEKEEKEKQHASMLHTSERAYDNETGWSDMKKKDLSDSY